MTAKYILTIIICLTIMSCQNHKCNCEFPKDVIMQNDSIVNSIWNQPENGFEKYWHRFEEPVLNNQQNESYRFSIVVLLSDYFKIYRAEKKNNQFNFHVKEYAVSTTTRSRKDSLVSSFSRQISKRQWLTIGNSFEENCFWTMPVEIKEDDGYLDGSGWILEGQKQKNDCTDSKYHLVHRISPDDSSKFVMICEKFMALDSLKVRRF